MKNSKKKTDEEKDNSAKSKAENSSGGKVKLVPGTSADITKEDLEALGPKDLSMDLGDDEDLKHRVHPVDFSGSDLDVPGAELDDEEESLGSEDEENNSYSLGGDDHDNR